MGALKKWLQNLRYLCLSVLMRYMYVSKVVPTLVVLIFLLVLESESVLLKVVLSTQLSQAKKVLKTVLILSGCVTVD